MSTHLLTGILLLDRLTIAVLVGDDDTHIQLCSGWMHTWHTWLQQFTRLLKCFVNADSRVHTLRQGLLLRFT